MTAYRSTHTPPPLVHEALRLAERMGFASSCAPEVGRLLHVLAGQHREGCIAEIGTGCGVGAAWIASALAPGVSFVTVELNPERAGAARALLAPFPNVRVLHGDWREILRCAPFAMLFPDAADAKTEAPETVLTALRPGGLVLLDDLTPESRWTAEGRARRSADPVRAFWLNDPRLLATEILVTPASAAILATRRDTPAALGGGEERLPGGA